MKEILDEVASMSFRIDKLEWEHRNCLNTKMYLSDKYIAVCKHIIYKILKIKHDYLDVLFINIPSY
jgi:hypothetical protein